MYVDGLQLTSIPVSRLIEAIDYLASKTVSSPAGNTPQESNDRGSHKNSHFDWNYINEQQKKEQKREKKWKQKRLKPKAAWDKFARAVENITGETI